MGKLFRKNVGNGLALQKGREYITGVERRETQTLERTMSKTHGIISIPQCPIGGTKMPDLRPQKARDLAIALCVDCLAAEAATGFEMARGFEPPGEWIPYAPFSITPTASGFLLEIAGVSVEFRASIKRPTHA
jgi:hypothetical protein